MTSPSAVCACRWLLAAILASLLAGTAHAQDTGGGGGGGGGGAAAGGATGGGGAAPAAGGPAANEGAAPGSLRAQIAAALPGVNEPAAGATTTPAWIITPGIALQQEWTDNAFLTATDHTASWITNISPSLSITGATSRLTADFYYAPTASLYANTPSQSTIGQTLGTDELLTLAPEELYLRTSGYAGVQSASAGLAPNGATAINKQNSVQSYSFTVEPYALHRFGGWGTLQAGVSENETNYSLLGGGGAQSLTQTQEIASFTTGENFGRVNSNVQVSATQDAGTGALQGASNDSATWQVGYAITHAIIALGSIGWEDIRYTGQGAPHYDDLTWSGGVQLQPNPDSAITVSYGHQQGATAAAVNASYAPTATIRLFATYQAGVTTAAQSLAGALGNVSFDAEGHAVNSVSGAPVALGSNFYGFNGTVYQGNSLNISASWLWPRDGFQLGYSRQTQTPIGNTVTGGTLLAASGTLSLTQGVASSSGSYGSFSWEHDLSPTVNLTSSVQYGILQNVTPLILSNGVLTASATQLQNVRQLSVISTLNWQITDTLSSSLQYSFSSTAYGGSTGTVAANLVVLGLQKNF